VPDKKSKKRGQREYDEAYDKANEGKNLTNRDLDSLLDEAIEENSNK
jgi:hypothetical protein